jgi:hypothetical protein
LDQVELSLPRDSLLVLIVDELERLRGPIEAGNLDQDILPYLRSLMQHRSRLSFILAGTHHLMEEFWQLVFNAGENLELTMLNRRETEKLIREPVQPMVRYDDLAVEHIWRAAAGHPYLIQLICHRLIQSENREESRQKIITIDQVHDVLERILDEDDGYLLRRWQELSQVEQVLLSSLAELQGPSDDAVPLEALVPQESGESTNLALKKLMQMGLVKKAVSDDHEIVEQDKRSVRGDPSEGAYMLAYGLLRRWIMKNQPAGMLTELGKRSGSG